VATAGIPSPFFPLTFPLPTFSEDPPGLFSMTNFPLGVPTFWEYPQPLFFPPPHFPLSFFCVPSALSPPQNVVLILVPSGYAPLFPPPWCLLHLNTLFISAITHFGGLFFFSHPFPSFVSGSFHFFPHFINVTFDPWDVGVTVSFFPFPPLSTPAINSPWGIKSYLSFVVPPLNFPSFPHFPLFLSCRVSFFPRNGSSCTSPGLTGFFVLTPFLFPFPPLFSGSLFFPTQLRSPPP